MPTTGEVLKEIVDRHVEVLKNSKGKLTVGEKDLTTVLDIFEVCAPVLMAAIELHNVRDREGTTREDFLMALTNLSLALKLAGMVATS